MNAPLDPVASARLAESGRLFTSDLSIDEFVLVESAGFEPLGLVMGTSVYHVGIQTASIRQSTEMQVLTSAMYNVRENAMARMQAEADALHADGIVGVRLEWRPHGASPEHIEYLAIGTAVRFTAKPGAIVVPTGGRSARICRVRTCSNSRRPGTRRSRSPWVTACITLQCRDSCRRSSRWAATWRCRSGRRPTTRRENSR